MGSAGLTEKQADLANDIMDLVCQLRVTGIGSPDQIDRSLDMVLLGLQKDLESLCRATPKPLYMANETKSLS